MSPPVIALSSCAVRAPYDGRDEHVHGANAAYERAVLRAGGLPVVLPYGVRGRRAAAVLGRADALVLTGGDDVGGSGLPARPGHADPARDASDAALLAAARQQRLPILGVCRGMQLLAARSGGRLAPVVGHAPIAGGAARRHRVLIDPGTWVADLPGIRSAVVPSLHTFAVVDPGRLLVAGRAVDGTIEAIAHPSRFELGVQWHPELSGGALGRPVWDALVRAAARPVDRGDGALAAGSVPGA